jgi:CBS domain-containing protein
MAVSRFLERHPETPMAIRPLRTIVAGRAPLTVSRDTTITDAAERMKAQNRGAAMVVDGTRLVGIFTERDALFRVIAARRDPNTTPVASVMTRDPQTIHPDRPFVEALRMMHVGRYRHLPVVEDGRPLGMVSARDALAPDLLELQDALAQEEFDRE